MFDSNRHGARDLYRKAVGGATDEELLFASPQSKAVNDWSPDGKYILFLSTDPMTTRDLWILPLDCTTISLVGRISYGADVLRYSNTSSRVSNVLPRLRL